MNKNGSKRNVKKETMKNVEYEVIKQTFEKLYALEQKHNESFHYIYDWDTNKLNKV
ncbi:hypothetical protein [Bacillus sp. MUM 116]|uniref:hypothetical protein n=1 Tax=Bacillus sp. MUM 116 TaxID=1678002 RepID=UPI0015A6BF98|nr:hypothetical protein [Bacillus sp. MUM 116]